MKNLSIVVLALVIAFYRCKKEDPVPVIDVYFSSQGIGVFAPCTVKFHSITHGEHYQWSFDGQASDSQDRDPVVLFNTPGTYNITLKVSGSEGTGELTQTVVIPPKATQLKINTIALTEYPLHNAAGNNWDTSSFSYPDIYFTILGLKPTFTPLYKHEAKMQDVSRMATITFMIPGGLTLPIVDDNYSLMIYDWDEFSDEIMGYIAFNPWFQVTKNGYYPESFTCFQEGCSATFNVTWQ